MKHLLPSRRFVCTTWLGMFIKVLLLVVVALSCNANGWEWADFVIGGYKSSTSSNVNNHHHHHHSSKTGSGDTYGMPTKTKSKPKPNTLSIQDVSELRVRDIKRRLTRTYGYSAEEVSKMIDKVELIHALAYEEEKIRTEHERYAQRTVFQQAVVATIAAIVVVYCWPLIMHAYEVGMINVVVYTDRKKYEASRCWELQTYGGMIGIVLMGILDILKVWLTVSILLSWFIKSKYFFPTPLIPIRASDVLNMGGGGGGGGHFTSNTSSSSSLGGYGINVGPMLIRWVLGYVSTQIEQCTARILLAAHKVQRSTVREMESETEKVQRKEAKRIRKLQKKQEQEQIETARAAALAAAIARNGSTSTSTSTSSTEQQQNINHDHLLDIDDDDDDTNTSINIVSKSTAPTGVLWNNTITFPSNGYNRPPNSSSSTGGSIINNKSRFAYGEEDSSEHQQPHYSTSHQEFLEQIDTYASELDEMD